ncbi:hypothetical protein [Jeongeupia chitinilytica]|uniref:Lipocalin-like domain-containing protein n=1 Tax=Jeongeupia chitinilytica TaxID=1041641 RepID=A0ABQ3GY56_9NEIS|nr:hypothetical protein [Jeongeupia chitinilytica]GHD58303.1 hypothetical protein GCM10007350_07980 [Jeongeupia chitinilytica]
MLPFKSARRLAALLYLAATCTVAANPEPAQLTGHWYLQGVREVGSELQLAPDQRFDWFLSYGAMDVFAQGKWQLEGTSLVLSTQQPRKKADFRPFTPDEMNIRKPAEPGQWIAIVGVPRTGPQPGVEVKFEAKSGKTATAVTEQNGEAAISMPDTESWSRVGLRHQGSNTAWQWLTVPEDRAAARLAAFAPADMKLQMPQAFKTMKLRVENDQLVVVDGDLEGKHYTRQ